VSAPDGHRPPNDTSDAPPARSGPRTSATDWLRPAPGGFSLSIAAAPRASRSEVTGVAAGWLRIRVAAPPVEGAANQELVRFLARALGVPKRAVTVTAGAAGRRKTVLVTGVAESAVRRLLPGGATDA
jgi:uncharacterized protein (TIGR00251 family)